MVTSVVLARLALGIILSHVALLLIDLIFEERAYISLVLIGVIFLISTNLELEMLY
jgi:hypothetical protein